MRPARVLCILLVAAALAAPASPAGAAGQRTKVIVSEPGHRWWVGSQHGQTVLTFGHVGCTTVDADGFCEGGVWPGIAGAHWIWRSQLEPEALIVHFQKVFPIPEGSTDISGSIEINADNAYRVFLNGEKVGGDGEFVFDSLQESWMTVSSHAINPVAGRNKLRVNVINYQGAGPEFNPAGLIWRIDVTFTPPA